MLSQPRTRGASLGGRMASKSDAALRVAEEEGEEVEGGEEEEEGAAVAAVADDDDVDDDTLANGSPFSQRSKDSSCLPNCVSA